MKTLRYIFGTLLLSIIIVSCSSVKTVRTWKRTDPLNLKEKTVIVFSKTNNNAIRTQFENDLTTRLKENNIKSIESYTLFPKIDISKKLNKFEKKELVKEFRNKGIDIVVLTVLKDTQKYTKTTTSGSGYSMRNYPVYNYNRYYGGFYSYYNRGFYQSESLNTITYEGKIYILETVIYDLTKSEENQLIFVITTEIDNPKTLGTISEDFSKRVVEQLVK
ncbi:hypothetical protein [uncultured Tenacibaculum sp.]|uniref:hypothetical protein n=1 Tax=uncultured Tenacibaculum sp. TaxID=174713 RepID=UPI00262E6435|nr:hypothetical protein [uncultured Tenacibaculum sp.]